MVQLLRYLVLAAGLLLAGCTGFDPSTPAALRPLDPLHDDLGTLLVAFDLPRGLGPIQDGQSLSFTVAGSKPVRVTLAPADADAVAGHLPPPAEGHAYYLFALPAADQATVRAAQASVAGAAVPPQVTVTVNPRLCAAGTIDPTKLSLSVLAALPGSARIVPLIDRELLADMIGPTGRLPACI